MKHFTLILIAGALLTAPAASAKKFAPHHATAKISNVKKDGSDRTKKTEAILKAARAAEFKPSKQEVYYSVDGEWILDMTVGLTYDAKGNITSVTEEVIGEPEIQRTDYTYDTYGNTTGETTFFSTDGGKNWTALTKREREYNDPVLHSLITLNEGYGFLNNEWWMQFGNKFEVIRNNDGNITDYNALVYFQGAYDATVKTVLNYPAGAKEPDSWTVSNLNYDSSWSEGIQLKEITWKSCNGQIAVTDYSRLLVGDNKVNSAKLYEGGEYLADLNVDYPNEKDFNAVASYSENGETGKEIHSVTYTDDYGSYIEKIIAEYTYDDDPGFVEREGEKYVIKYDEHGNEISETAIFIEGDLEETEGIITFEHTYGDNGELLQTITSEMDYDTKEMMPVEKLVASDFVEITLGIDNVTSSQSINCTIEDGAIAVTGDGEIRVNVYSVTGALMLTASGNGSVNADTTMLPGGVYVATVSNGNGSTTLKFAK